MKRTLLSCLAFAALSLASADAITITINATAGSGSSELKDFFGNDLPAGRLGLLVIDTAANGVGTFKQGPFTLEAFYDGTDNYIAGSVASSLGFGSTSVVAFSAEGASHPLLAAGQPYYVVWFSNTTTPTASVSFPDTFGSTRDASWVLPSDGGTNSGLPAAPGGNASTAVIPVPEPSTFVFTALGLSALAARRRRRTIA